MGVKKTYERLVKRWGRELANEIIAKRLAEPKKSTTQKASGKKKDMLDSWGRLPGSFEAGKKR